jgi:hypothetical protein
MMGYARERADLARGAEIETLATGDIAIRDPHGLFRIVGRRQRMSKIAGRRLGHDSLEAALAAQGIAASVVGDDLSLLAVFTGPQAELRVRERLAAAAGLTLGQVAALRLDALPRLASGKPDHRALRGLLEAHRPPEAAGVLEAFREAFHPLPVTPADSFEGLSGDSLRHVELTLALERLLGHVPEGWERRAVADLAGLAEGAPEARGAIGTDLVVRAAAILLVVVQHATLWPVPAGSTALMLLIGYGLARHQRAALATGDRSRIFRVLPAVLAPYYLIVIGYALAWGSIPWASVFLVGNFGFADPVRHDMLPYLYWFVEAFVQTLLVWGALFLIPAVRRLGARDPFRLGLIVLAGGLAARFGLPELWDIGNRRIFTLPWVFWLTAFGWCAATAGTPRRRWLLVGLAAAVMPAVAYDGGNWTGAWVRYGSQIVVIAALCFAPRVRLPAPALALLLPVAAASYYIYLFHRLPPELLLERWAGQLPSPAVTALGVLTGVALGLAAHGARRPLRQLAAQVPRPSDALRAWFAAGNTT